MARNIRIQFSGRRLEGPQRPQLLQAARRGAPAADPFLPEGYVEVSSVHELSAAARSAGDAQPFSLDVALGTVIVLELSDGTTVVTSAARLQRATALVGDQAAADDVAVLSRLYDPQGARRGIVGDVAGNLILRIFTLAVGRSEDPIIEDARRELARLASGKARDAAKDGAALGVTWLGTKALMWAIERRLARQPGLYRWSAIRGEPSDLADVDGARLEADARQGPLLVFIHGTASSTQGSFGDLGAGDEWQLLASRFAERIYAFEHHTLSASPIRNAIDLAARLPQGAQINIVTHSRGGIVGDLLCLDGIARGLIDDYGTDSGKAGESGDAEGRRAAREAGRVYEEHRRDLRELHRILTAKQFVIQRYVRVACPARGTRLASGNLDVFLSGLLTLIGWVPVLAGNPIYSAFKRVVIEIARNRTDPRLVPGIEAMLPESPMARLLARATPRPGVSMAVIAGDTDASEAGLLKRLGALFTDFMFFDGFENDLVVDTDSMYTGIAPTVVARCRFDAGAKVTHFRYFENQATREALRDWLTVPDVASTPGFSPLPVPAGAGQEPSLRSRLERAVRSRDVAGRAPLPIVVVVPGIMGSHLWINQRDRVWFDPADLLVGGLRHVRWGTRNVEAEDLFGMFYGDLCEFLAATHEVEPFAYDWRLPLDRLADQFGLFLARLLEASPARPVRILAHSMGGLVMRALTYRRPDIVEALMGRDGARLVMLGTPHQGSHLMVETLLGKSGTIRMLGRLDLKHGLQEILDIVAGFRGALQLLPRTGFIDAGGRRDIDDFFQRRHWQSLRREARDAWFGNDVGAVPDQAALDAARWLWDQDALELADLDGRTVPGMWPSACARHEPAFRAKTVYVYGKAARTPCGLTCVGGRWKMLGTEQGDGSVTWESGTIRGIGSTYHMPVEHGALTGTDAFFPAIGELLTRGETTQLSTAAPRTRGLAAPVPYDAGPVPYPTAGEIAAPLLGTAPRRMPPRTRSSLTVSVRAMDLRFVTRPILVGHYEQDPISGAEAIIDSQLVGRRLSERYHMGMYPGAVGTVVVVLQPPNQSEQLLGSLRGAVVTGLGTLDGSLSESRLTEAVHAGALRFLMHYADCSASPSPDIGLSTLLIGYNSSASLGIKAAVAALVNGVVSANQKYREATRRALRITSLEIVELYLDTALSTMYALRDLATDFREDRNRSDTAVEVSGELLYGPGWRHRLDDSRGSGYWPRLMIMDADRDEDIGTTSIASPAGADAGSTLPVPHPASNAIAARLRYTHVGPRARAETIVRQRQPGVVEGLVERQIRSNTYDRDFCRTLFQLMVPHEFKDAARQLQRIVLVLDAYTANLPWELMLADDRPLAARTPVVRQLVSARYRSQVRPARRLLAYVIGNPSTEGFRKAFAIGGDAGDDTGLDPLSRAEDEARRVVDVLRRNRFEVTASIGIDRKALDVLNPLYKQEYRIIHVAAHGIFELRHRDGGLRTGIVLSDGLLITAAEIAAMERVPDLVFLNCCHLARVNAGAVAYNRLAYSIARELMDIGVRCVVAAGWPVDDQAAESFAAVFYEALVTRGMPFGDAVYEARDKIYEQYPTSMTWGAYQAYGDPGWQIGLEGGMDTQAAAFVSPVELADRLARVTVDLNQQGRLLSSAEAVARAKEIQRITKRGSEHWLEDPQVLNVLAAAYAQLGPTQFETACEYYRRAIAADDQFGHVPIRAIEQLANIEARHGELTDDLSLVERAIHRLEALNAVVDGSFDGTPVVPRNRERLAALGSAYKRKAAHHARRLLAGGGAKARQAFRDDIQRSIDFYDTVARAAGARDPQPYPLLNTLALRAVHDDLPADAVDVCDRCIEVAVSNFVRTADFWDAVTLADARCVRAICSGELASDDDTGDAAIDQLREAYRSTLAHVLVHPKRMDSVARQIALLALFFEAAGLEQPIRNRTARRLRRLAEGLRAVAEGTLVPAEIVAQAEQGGPGPETPSPARQARRSSGALRRKKSPKGTRKKPRR